MGDEIKIVEKGTEEFKKARSEYLRLLGESTDLDILRRGIFEFGEHKGKCLGITSQRIIDAKLPMPFGCPSLFVQVTEGGGIIWFCGRVGCICSCCREDMKEEWTHYPKYCPLPEGFENYLDEGDYDEDWDVVGV